MARVFASKLRAVGIISDRGLQVGKLYDILFDERDGKILSLVVKPISKEALGNIPKDENGNVVIPFNAVMSVRDYIVVDERVLVVQQLKVPPKSSA